MIKPTSTQQQRRENHVRRTTAEATVGSKKYLSFYAVTSGIVFLTLSYWKVLYGYVFLHHRYGQDTTVFKDDVWAKVQVYSLSLIFKLWSKSHYRSPSFKQDMLDNLKNVAIPGTGIALSTFCRNWWTCLLFVFFMNPLICMFGAMNKAMKEQEENKEEEFCLSMFLQSTYRFYATHLLHPDDWFSLWRLNCRLASYHSYITQAEGYKQEDKWTFLTEGKALGVPVSPFIDNVPSIVLKHKSIEGGMGIFFYQNAAAGGDWIIQQQMTNADWLKDLLPSNSPLSTMRVITTSTWSLCHHKVEGRGQGRVNPHEGRRVQADPQATERDFFVVSGVKSRLRSSAQSVKDRLQCSPYNLGGITSPGSGGMLTKGGSSSLAPGISRGNNPLPGGSKQPSRHSNQTSSSSSSSSMNAAASTSSSMASDSSSSSSSSPILQEASRYVRAVSSVLRLGRSGALTDHSSVLFDVGVQGIAVNPSATGNTNPDTTLNSLYNCFPVPSFASSESSQRPNDFDDDDDAYENEGTGGGHDGDTAFVSIDSVHPADHSSSSVSSTPLGLIRRGMTNAHWYKLGLRQALKCSWLPEVGFECHPDEPQPLVTGKVIPGMQMALDIVIASHYKLMKDVPIVGWDVTFTPHGIFLLEVNLSCNFFRGSFDYPEYIAFVDAYWEQLDRLEHAKKHN